MTYLTGQVVIRQRNFQNCAFEVQVTMVVNSPEVGPEDNGLRRCSRPLVCCTQRSDSPGRRACSCEPPEVRGRRRMVAHAGSRRWSLSPEMVSRGRDAAMDDGGGRG
ncbi:DNA ligase [Striga asiatica]|uniref:DNA ligase n=1 Tax=Striga asiatica TaxID=4170 RepID=A0A5A7PH32_STRAF|nr:DNA ligase [Striga asiatica]